MGRTADRNGFTDTNRIQLLESDADRHDELWQELREELEGMRKVLVGILVSVSTACVLLVVNVLALGHR